MSNGPLDDWHMRQQSYYEARLKALQDAVNSTK